MGKFGKLASSVASGVGSVKRGLTPGSAAGKSSMINYMFILCFFLSVIPGLIEVVFGKRLSEDGIDSINIIACKFGDIGKGMNTGIESSTSLRNIKELLSASVDKSNTKVVTRQDVTIEQADDINEELYAQMLSIQQECPGNGIAGFLGYTNKKNAYGCIPDVNQNVDIKMTQLSEDVVNYAEEITSAVASELVAEASGSSGSSDEEILNKFENDVVDEIKKKNRRVSHQN